MPKCWEKQIFSLESSPKWVKSKRQRKKKERRETRHCKHHPGGACKAAWPKIKFCNPHKRIQSVWHSSRQHSKQILKVRSVSTGQSNDFLSRCLCIENVFLFFLFLLNLWVLNIYFLLCTWQIVSNQFAICLLS